MKTFNRLATATLLFAAFTPACDKKQEQPAPAPPSTQAMAPAATPAPPTSPAPESRPTGTPVAKPTSAPPAGGVTTPPPAGGDATPAAPPPGSATAAPTTTQASPSASPSASRLPTRPQPDKVALPATLGAVTFDHKKHAQEMGIECARCHHSSRPQKPLVAERQACRGCHTSPPTPPVATNRQRAFHDAKAGAGTCIDCHREAAAKGKKAPAKCADCHKKDAR